MLGKIMGRRGKKQRRVYAPEDLPTIVVESPLASEEGSSGSAEEETSDEVPPLPQTGEIRLALRRNSVSLPNLDDLELQVLKDQVEMQGQNNFQDDSDIDVSDDELVVVTPERRVPLRNVRRKSVTAISRRMLKPPGDDESSTTSPANSITSINSLASLLREKMQMLPSTLKKKKPKEYKIKAFVSILFLVIVFLVGIAYILYQQKVLHRAYFDKIKFNKIKREIKIFNADGLAIIRGQVGTTMNYDKVHPCLPTDDRHDGSICLEWMHRARMYLHFYELNSEVRCYSLEWMSLSSDVDPTDCYDISQGSGSWYGGGQTSESAWPLSKGNHAFAPFVTGRVDRHEWGNVLKRYFINSKGAVIIVDNSTPLYVSIQNGTGNVGKQLCLKAKYDDFAFANRLTPLPHLNYSICTASSMTRLHSYMTEKSLWDGLKPDEINVIHSLMTEPLWEITSASKKAFTEGTVLNYTEDVIALGFLKQGHVLINEFWQTEIGDFTVDPERFATLEATMTMMHRRGFRVVFSIQPFISTESANFAETVKKRLLVSERYSDRRIPALTRYKSLQSAGVLDVTNNNTVPWLLEKLKNAMNQFKFDAYYLDLGIAFNMPHYYQCEHSLINPDQYKTLFINSLQGSLSLFGVNSAIERPRAPTFVSLPMFESSWDGIRRVIPTILTYGLIGYPFLIPGAVGGDYEAPGSWTNNNVTSDDILLPDKELYVRWLQLATFLPVIRFTHLPSKYGDEKVLEMAIIMTSLRQKTVTPLLKKYASISLDFGLPLIRPLWMLEPNDPACHVVVDEFSVGDELIVAPVLYSGAREREVYLPAGVWKDGIDGSMRKGSRWIHDYTVGEDQIAYFEKMPDNTRF